MRYFLRVIRLLKVILIQGKITAPVKYLTEILENLNNKDLSNNADNSKSLMFNNLEPREYDYEELERKLLGWDK